MDAVEHERPKLLPAPTVATVYYDIDIVIVRALLAGIRDDGFYLHKGPYPRQANANPRRKATNPLVTVPVPPLGPERF